MRMLQNKRLGDTSKSDGLSVKEIKQILDHSYMNTDLESRQDRGFDLILHKDKNNQDSAFYRNIHRKTGFQHISISPYQPNNQYTPVKDILLFLSKLPESTLVQDPLFYETSKSKKNISTAMLIPYSPQDLDDDYISEYITEDESDIGTYNA
ncbi:16014_t:CDS:2 [Funneliformis mosseae]|uniref:16014_t:CDS:1 n=1 Tax=Funneliformis mosseae TaxID=27381 RepID=A0A9N9E8N9_FUNMO|nr:16014_t:CDS:2 [Funneliformis mosseae]